MPFNFTSGGATIGGTIGGGVGAVVGAVIGGILDGFSALFGGGGTRELRDALNNFRGEVSRMGAEITRFAWSIAHALGWLIQAMHTAWVRVLRPLVDKVRNLVDRVRRLVDRVLQPYFEALARIRRVILDIYTRYVRPVVVAIETVRRVLYVLRLARIKWAEKLDRELAQLEARITKPILDLLAMTVEHSRWLNWLLNVRMLLQWPVLLGSMRGTAAGWMQFAWAFHDEPLSAAELARRRGAAPALSAGQASEYARQAVVLGAGPWAAQVAQASAAARAAAGV